MAKESKKKKNEKDSKESKHAKKLKKQEQAAKAAKKAAKAEKATSKKNDKAAEKKASKLSAKAKAKRLDRIVSVKEAKAERDQAKQVVDIAKGSDLALARPHGYDIDLETFTSVRDLDPNAAVDFDGSKTDGEALMASRVEHLADLQERLFAAYHSEEQGRRVLLVVQGMDTSGKGGIMRHVVGSVDPQGVKIHAFKAPTPTEKNRHFLWRIRRELPAPGYIGVFDRSHYEDVLIHKVHGWANDATLTKRYADINRFEKQLVEERGYEVVKVMLHISSAEQWDRLFERLERPDKNWKFNPGDLDEREHWDEYMDAYDAAIRETHTDWAPWHVIPADKKWYAHLAVQQLLIEALERINPQFPAADFDVEAQKKRMLAAAPEGR